MKGFKQLFGTLSYRKKIMIYYLLAVSIPFVIGTAYFYQTIVSSSQTSLDNSINQRLEQDTAAITNKLTTIHDYGYSFSVNSTLNNFFSNEHHDDVELVNTLDSSIKPIFSWMENTSKNYGDFRFLTLNKTIPEGEYSVDLNQYLTEPWAIDLKENINDNGYFYEPYHQARDYLYAKTKEKKTFSILYFLPNARNTYLEIDINSDYLFSESFNTPILDDGNMIFITNNKQVISNNSDITGLENELVDALKKEGETITVAEKRYYVKKREIPKLYGQLYSLIPANNIETVTNKAQFTFLAIISGLVLLLLFISYGISTLLLKRINTMQEAVQTIQEGDFNISIPVNSFDEIDELAKAINVMSFRINELITAVYAAEVNQKEAELSALQSQINPHFLFNTLETFRMMSELEQNEELSSSLVSLGNIMRYNLSASQARVSLKDELKIIVDYVTIQNLLYNNRIILKMDLDHSLMSVSMPSFILQPLLENSIIHNIHEIEGDLKIFITGRKKESGIEISVTDNGVGMTTEELERLRVNISLDRSSRSSNKHVGLWNVNQRLQLYFLNQSELRITKNSDGGITTFFDIPFKK